MDDASLGAEQVGERTDYRRHRRRAPGSTCPSSGLRVADAFRFVVRAPSVLCRRAARGRPSACPRGSRGFRTRPCASSRRGGGLLPARARWQSRIESSRSFSTTFSDSLSCFWTQRDSRSRLLVIDSSGLLISCARLTAISPAVASCCALTHPPDVARKSDRADFVAVIVVDQRARDHDRDHLALLVAEDRLEAGDPARCPPTRASPSSPAALLRARDRCGCSSDR